LGRSVKNLKKRRKENTYQIRNTAEKYGIALIYLFGSQSKNGAGYLQGSNINAGDLSDLDLAVSFKSIPSHPMKIYGALYKELSEIFEPFNIDLVFMHEVDVLFQYEIIKGIRIFEEDESFADELEEMVMKRAEDLAFKKRIMNREILEAIEDGYIEFEYRADS
jgi:predicted nucleotidyltransferase